MKTYMTILLIAFSLLIAHSQNLSDRLSTEEKIYTSRSGIKVKGLVGTFTVPENRAETTSKDINISFVLLKSSNPNAGTPLVFLEGGPGSSCTWQAEDPDYLEDWIAYLEVSDVLLVDQRGTGAGGERVTWIWMNDIPTKVLSDPKVLESHLLEVGKEAAQYYKDNDIDIRGYTTKANATDIDELRQALGFDKLNLMGFSYGTHLGLAYIRYFEGKVGNAILAGVEGPNHTFKLPSTMETQFRKIALMAKQDPSITKDIPDLMALYNKVCKKLDAEPAKIEVLSPITQQPMPIEVGSIGLSFLLRLDIGDASDLPVFPRLIFEIDKGNYAPLKWFVQKRITAFYGIQAMSSVMDFASGLSESRKMQIDSENTNTLFGSMVNPRLHFTQAQFKDSWVLPDMGDKFREPLVTNTRTLFLSGTLDFNTPPFQAEEVRWGFANSHHIIVKYAGHEQILSHPKTHSTIIKFLKGESVDDITIQQPKLKFIPITGSKKDVWHPSLDQN